MECKIRRIKYMCKQLKRYDNFANFSVMTLIRICVLYVHNLSWWK